MAKARGTLVEKAFASVSAWLLVAAIFGLLAMAALGAGLMESAPRLSSLACAKEGHKSPLPAVGKDREWGPTAKRKVKLDSSGEARILPAIQVPRSVVADEEASPKPPIRYEFKNASKEYPPSVHKVASRDDEDLPGHPIAIAEVPAPPLKEIKNVGGAKTVGVVMETETSAIQDLDLCCIYIGKALAVDVGQNRYYISLKDTSYCLSKWRECEEHLELKPESSYSTCTKRLQKALGLREDGLLGKASITKLEYVKKQLRCR